MSTEKTSNGNPVLRARFTVPDEDYRPVVWPIDHPYWCSGFNDEGNTLIAYVENEEQLLKWWPDAINIDLHIDGGLTDSYTYSSRFQRPEWFAAQHPDSEVIE